MVPLGLWNDMRLPSFFSGVFFCPVSESKRGKVRITFMFPSPQLVTSCRFPAPWVDSSFVNSERASQPASDVSCERWTTFSLSFALSPPSLSFSLCFYPPALALPLSHRPLSLSSSSSPAVRRNDSRWNQFTLPSSPCLSQQTEIRPTSIRVLPLWMGAWEEKMDSVGKRGVLKLEMEKKESGGWTRRWMEEKGGFNAKCRLSKKGM